MGVRGKMGRPRGDPGKIHRSRGFSVQECQRKYREGDEEGRCWCGEYEVTRMRVRGGLGGEGEDETRTVMHGGVLGSPVGSDEGD